MQFEEKPQGGAGWVSGGFFVAKPSILDYIEGDDTVFEQVPLNRLSSDGELTAYRHNGFWHGMDTLWDKIYLDDLWTSDKAPWRTSMTNPMSDAVGSSCRFCGSPLEQSFCDLGMSPLANSYLVADQLNDPEVFYPLHAYVCSTCFLVQLAEFTSADSIFSDYAYFSSYSQSWLDHASNYARSVISRFGLEGRVRSSKSPATTAICCRTSSTPVSRVLALNRRRTWRSSPRSVASQPVSGSSGNPWRENSLPTAFTQTW